MSSRRTIIKALVDSLIFLEFSDDNAVDPDAPVALMEQVSATLQQMNPDDKQFFLETLSRLAEEELDFDKKEFISTLGESLSLC